MAMRAWMTLLMLAGCGAMGVDTGEGPKDSDGPDTLRWVSVDPHLHPACNEVEFTPAQLVERMKASGIEIGSNLINSSVLWRESEPGSGAVYRLGDEPVSEPGYVLHNDFEIGAFVDNDPGHLLLYGLDQLTFQSLGATRNLYEYSPSNVSAIDWALGQSSRVVAGYAHAWAWPSEGFPTRNLEHSSACCVPFELPINVARGKVHFFSDEANPQNVSWLSGAFGTGPLTPGGFAIWRRLLNVGFPIAILGGSDVGCLSEEVGAPRTLALIEGEVSFEAFLDAVRRGRTVLSLSRDERLDLRVDGARLGDQIRSDDGTVSLEVRSTLENDTTIEVLVNGEVTALPAPAGDHASELPMQLERSSWIALRTRKMQTSPVYVLVGDERGIRASADDACYLMQYVDHLRDVVLPSGGIQMPDAERAVSLAAYQEARAVFEMRFAEAGGVTCP